MDQPLNLLAHIHLGIGEHSKKRSGLFKINLRSQFGELTAYHYYHYSKWTDQTFKAGNYQQFGNGFLLVMGYKMPITALWCHGTHYGV